MCGHPPRDFALNVRYEHHVKADAAVHTPPGLIANRVPWLGVRYAR
ncbi:hypothetical protein ACWZEH_32095 [Streptomyces sp. QTS137]